VSSAKELDALLESRRVVISCGSGGVGKTTISATLALRAATLGKRAIVCTIDPARRLANALGLSELGNDVVLVAPERLAGAGITLRGSLSAMMLDTKHTFDRVIERYAKTEEAKRKVLDNRFYQEISSQIVGSHEYMAMEKLHELHESGKYDLIVLDTPPSKHAFDFLTAPKRMTDILDSSVFEVLMKPFDVAGRLTGGLMGRVAKRIAKKIDEAIGMQFVYDVTEFFRAFDTLYEGFRARAQNVDKLLREPFTAFVVVAAPMPIPLEEARFFCEKIGELGMPLAALLLNRVQWSPLASLDPVAREALIPALAQPTKAAWAAREAAPEPARDAVAKAVASLLEQELLARADQRRIDALLQGPAKGLVTRQIPRFPDDVHDLEGLRRVSESLFG
jgi:anion-transporting  ArsA/GET3 family ATPase